MVEHWIIYDAASGGVLYRASGPEGASSVQLLEKGQALVVVPAQAFRGPEIDLGVIRLFLMAKVDFQAEQVRLRFVTGGAGQAMTYARKGAEGRAWMADNTVTTPFLSAEAAATGIPLAMVAAEVVARADAWVQIGSAIEGTRMGAKAGIDRAVTLGEVVAAATVDWSVFGG